MNVAEMADEARRLSTLLDEALADHHAQVATAASAEREYRKAKARAWFAHPDGTAKQREAQVDAESADLRHARDMAEGLRQAALEAIRSRRAQISLLQSELAAHRAEADYVRTGPGMAA